MAEKIITRFWAGRPMPEAYVRYGKQWAELNPRHSVVTFGMEILNHLPENLYGLVMDISRRDAGREGIEKYVQIADVVGYFLVWQYGGLYVNCDMQPVRPLPDDLPNKAWASYENDVDGRVVNAAIGAPEPLDPFWGTVLDGLVDNYFSNPEDEMVMSTGPGYLTRVYHEHPDRLHVMPRVTFNPVHWKQIRSGGDASEVLGSLPEETIAVHHWGHRKDGRTNYVETATQ